MQYQLLGFRLRIPLRALLVLVACVCTQETVRPQEFVIEGKRIAEILIMGNQRIPRASIEGVLTLEPGSEVTTEKIESDKERIQKMGYFYDVQVRTENTQRGTIVTFVVFENPEVKSIEIEGNELIPTAQLLEQMKTKPGDVLNSVTVDRDAESIEAYYKKQGYLAFLEDAKISEGVLKVRILEARIEAIRFPKKKGKGADHYGLFKTKERIVRREMTSRPGEKLNYKKLKEDMRAIYNLGLFDESLHYELKQGSDAGLVVVEIIAKEKKTGTAAVGLGFSSRSEVVGFVDVTESNFKGRGESVAFRGETGDRKTYEVSYGNPWIDNRRTALSVGVYDRLIYREPRGWEGITATTTSTFEERRKGGRIGFSRPWKQKKRTRIGIQLRNESVGLVQTETATETTKTFHDYGRIMGIALTGTRDTRDVVFDPTSGRRQSLTIEQAVSFLGGDASFTKVDLDLRQYRKTLKKYVLAGRLVLGFGLSGDLPPFEQYYVGGSDTIRGYNIDHDYGEKLALLNVELRRRLHKSIQAVAFVDYGDAWSGPNSNGPSFSGNLGYGLGMRVQTPIGPIRLDYGIGSEGSQVHFSIGQAF